MDPGYGNQPVSEKNHAAGGPLLSRLAPIIALTAACWLVFVFNNLIGDGHLSRYGIIPRHLRSLSGIIWAPFLHGSFQHLAANTVPLLILGGILCARSRTEFALVTVGGMIAGGGLTWLLARNASHIGASGLIFCYFAYLASLAWFRRTFGALLLSAVCILGYGGMLRGVLPTSAAVSWEGHIAGLMAGIALGWLAARLKKPATDASNPVPGDMTSPAVSKGPARS
jgi:membrane associated rhomboid family serine protease